MIHMIQHRDPTLTEQQWALRRVLAKNAKRKLGGDKYRGIRWVKSKQAQCAIIGHLIHTKKCVYCGAEE